MPILLIIIVVFLLFGGGYGYNAGWHSSYPGTYWGGSSIGLIVVVLVVLFLMGRL